MEHTTDRVTKWDRRRDQELLQRLAEAEEQLQRRPRPSELAPPQTPQNQSPWDARDML